MRRADRHRGQLRDAPAADLYRERFRAQPRPAAVWAGHLADVALDLLAHPVGVGVAVAPLQPRHDSFELGVVAAQGAVSVAVLNMHAAGAGAVEDDLALWLCELGPGLVHAETTRLGDGFQHTREVLGARSRPGSDRTVRKREIRVRHDQIGIDLEAGAETVARGARPER